MVQVVVRGDVDKALKALRKKIQKDGDQRRLRERAHYIPPNEQRRRNAARAAKKRRKK